MPCNSSCATSASTRCPRRHCRSHGGGPRRGRRRGDAAARAADAALLERAIANIVENAIAWSPPGVPVRVVACVAQQHVDLHVVDRGPGIPASEREDVFRPFQRLGDRFERQRCGPRAGGRSGFVEAMGGQIVVDDTPVGGVVTMVISLQWPHDARPGGRRRAADLRALGINLRARGYDVDLAPDGEHALTSPPHTIPTWWSSTSGCGDRRGRGDPRPAGLEHGAHRGPVGARRGARQGRRARCRCRRLRDQALRQWTS